MVHHRQVAREIKDEYVDTISKVYFSYFKAYISKLSKLQVYMSAITGNGKTWYICFVHEHKPQFI